MTKITTVIISYCFSVWNQLKKMKTLQIVNNRLNAYITLRLRFGGLGKSKKVAGGERSTSLYQLISYLASFCRGPCQRKSTSYYNKKAPELKVIHHLKLIEVKWILQNKLGLLLYYTIATAVKCNIRVVMGFLSFMCTDKGGISSLLHCFKETYQFRLDDAYYAPLSVGPSPRAPAPGLKCAGANTHTHTQTHTLKWAWPQV